MPKRYHVEKEWITRAGLKAVAIFADRIGHRCGYVGIPPEHPLYNIGCSDSCAFLKDKWEEEKQKPLGKRSPILMIIACRDEPSPELCFDVHGGLTYSDGGEKFSYPIEGENLWWFGFDCGHFMDKSRINPTGEERTLDYVVNECEQLARMLVDVNL